LTAKLASGLVFSHKIFQRGLGLLVWVDQTKPIGNTIIYLSKALLPIKAAFCKELL
jgi:hypothetical protein